MELGSVWDSLNTTVASGWAPGIVAGVRHRGTSTVFATGHKDLAGTGEMAPDTPFRVASLSKLVGGALAVSMLADGFFGLDDPVDRWLPELANPRVLVSPEAQLDQTVPAEGPITVRQLLTLTNGMGVIFGNTPLSAAIVEAGVEPGPIPAQMSADEFMTRIGALPLAYQPGTRWAYHLGSDLLSVLLSRAGGAPLRHLLKERITGPIGMDSTKFFGDANMLPPAYRPTSAGLELFDEPDGTFSRSPQFETFGSGLVSTVPDYLAFLSALADDTLLPAGLRAQMTSDQLTPGQHAGMAEMAGAATSWGWQVSVETGVGEPWSAPGRYGWTGGMGTSAYVDPSRDLIGVVFTQRLMAGPNEDFGYFWEPLVAAI